MELPISKTLRFGKSLEMERVSGPAAGKKSPFRRNCTQADLPRLWRISSALWRISLRFGGSVCALADQFCALAAWT